MIGQRRVIPGGFGMAQQKELTHSAVILARHGALVAPLALLAAMTIW
jgi:hypothetical protein